jgi:hypothetical protein
MTKQSDVSTARAQASLLAVLSVASITPAFAYIDPGTGSMVLQMALAGIAGALFYFRQLRLAAVDWFRRVVLRQSPAPVLAETKPASSESAR